MNMKRSVAIISASLSLWAWSGAATEPSVAFTFVPSYGSAADVTGAVSNVVFADCRVAVYIFAGGWWTKPTFANPLTVIQTNGSWSCDITTGGADSNATQIAAFLVSSNYSPPQAAGLSELPATLYSNALARAVVVRPFTRRVQFSGYEWSVKDSLEAQTGPGSNYFSDSTSNVWVDAGGKLHLKVAQRGGRWYCAELVSVRSFGYGTYRVSLDSTADSLDANTVLGLFTWNDDGPFTHREIDVEISRWSNPSDTNNAQFVVQPFDQPNHLTRFRVPTAQTNSTHCFTWLSNRVDFACYAGRYAMPPATNLLLASWARPEDGTPLTGGENFRMNLWLFNAVPPTNNADQEVVISRFAFVPSPLPAAVFTNAEISAAAGLRLRSAAESSLTYRIEVSSNLAVWGEAGEVIATTNGIEYTETTNSPGDRRFFRAVTPEQ